MPNKMGLRHPRRWLGSVTAAVLSTLAGGFVLLTPLGNGLRHWSYDLLFCLRPARPATNVVVVYLDESSYSKLNASPDSFSRTNHALLLDSLKTRVARMVVFDVLFIDKNKPTNTADHILAKAIRDFGDVVLGAQSEVDQSGGYQIFAPLDLFLDATPGSNSWGLAKIHCDSDFGVRRIDPGSANYPSLAWKAAELSGAIAAQNRATERWLNYYGKAPFPEIAYWKVAKGALP